MTPIRWVGCAPRNFLKGRPGGHAPRAIVLHRTGGSLREIGRRFSNPISSLSSHYVVGRDGSIEQYVAEADAAFHAGIILNPTWTRLTPKVNPNFYTVGIEHEGGDDDWPDAQRTASAALIAEVAARWSIPLAAAHVIPHSAIRASVACPGPSCPLDDLLARAQRSLDDAAVLISTDEMELAGRTARPASAAPRIDRTGLSLSADQYYGQVWPKDLIVLHFTAGGTARSAVDTWRSNPEHVATAYVVDLDGTIYEVFPPRFWAYHLGVKGATAHERRSIGIEIVNVGPLQRSAEDPATLNWWPPGNSWGKRYCSLDESSRYLQVTYRDKHYFATFPEAQLDAVSGLVAQVCDEFNIPRLLPRADDRLACSPATFAGFKGIATHANFRPDKWDIGPAFGWDRLGL
ncbi:MAG: hypothetical protein GEU82_13625 [Luteitalea sp.]|nr:hypothetical protein [Luteitalea sp.]